MAQSSASRKKAILFLAERNNRQDGVSKILVRTGTHNYFVVQSLLHVPGTSTSSSTVLASTSLASNSSY